MKGKPFAERKIEEQEYHNLVRGEEVAQERDKYDYYYSNAKYYSVNRQIEEFWQKWLKQRCPGKTILEYGCGNGTRKTWFSARNGAHVTGIDISDVSIAKATERAKQENVGQFASFIVMDCESLAFHDKVFDVIVVGGVLHHLDVTRAFPELARVLKSSGEIICIDPLAYNPVIQLYRRLTPELRTEWEMEHILSREELALAKRYFDKFDIRFFHLTTLMAVPFRNLPMFNKLLSCFEAVDKVLLKIPGLKWWAWQMVFTLSSPKKINAAQL